MKVFYDCEFIEDGSTIDLISIGMVTEDRRELYLQNNECRFKQANGWVRSHVFPSLRYFDAKRMRPLDGPYDAPDARSVWASKSGIASSIERFIGDDAPEWWGYYSAYDHVALCQLFGPMMSLPQGWPMWTNDLQQWHYQLDTFHDYPSLSDRPNCSAITGEHNALNDARWNRDAWHHLASLC